MLRLLGTLSSQYAPGQTQHLLDQHLAKFCHFEAAVTTKGRKVARRCHVLVFAHILHTQYIAPPVMLCTCADGSVKCQDLRWTKRLSNVDVVPTAFTSSLAVALFILYWVLRHREKDIGLRGISAFWGVYWFAHYLKDMGFSCTWVLWLGRDGMHFLVDEWVDRRQRKRLRLDFEELVREGLEKRPERVRDMYREAVIPGP